MSIITILNIFLMPCLAVILVAGAILNYKYIEKNIYQRYLISTFVFWAFVMCGMYVKFFIDAGATISFVNDICSVQVILLGIPCFFTLISYPVTLLNSRYLSLRRWGVALRPLIVSVSIYFAYHLFAGIDPFTKYATLDELLQNATSVSVLLRFGIIATFFFTTIRDTRRLWRVVPLYNQYVQENISDSACNVEWIRRLVIYINVVSSLYFLMLFFCSPYVNLIYISSLILLFFYIVEMSLLHRTSESAEHIEIRKDPNNPGQYIFFESEVDLIARQQKLDDDTPCGISLEQIDQWMAESAPYTNIDFTTNEILEAFPSLSHSELTQLFRSRGETFQSYVRRFRIIKACEILANEAGRSYPKQTYALVGFSHHSSFSRSFVALAKISPSEYLKLPKEGKELIIMQVTDNQ